MNLRLIRVLGCRFSYRSFGSLGRCGAGLFPGALAERKYIPGTYIDSGEGHLLVPLPPRTPSQDD